MLSLIGFARNKGGPLRSWVDYRGVNAVTTRESYPIQQMDECIKYFGDANGFSSLDATAGYWQTEMDEDGTNKTAFVTYDGLLRYRRMTFSLKNAPATVQQAMDVILAMLKWQFALVYFFKFVALSKFRTKHITQVAFVLPLMKSAGPNLKLKIAHSSKTQSTSWDTECAPGQWR